MKYSDSIDDAMINDEPSQTDSQKPFLFQSANADCEANAAPVIKTIALVLALLITWSSKTNAEEEPGFPVRVAAVQFNPRLGVLQKNVESLARQFERAAQNGAKIIVAPEMATTGYLYQDRQDIADVVEPIPGPTTRRFAKIAQKYGCYLVWGMAERDQKTGLFYNSAAIVGPNDFLGKYRKTHLWEAETHWAAWGNLGVPVFETEFGRIAILICQDANYVETFRLAALKQADIVCFSTNSSGQTIGHLQVRAIQNGLFVISANRSNAEVDRYHKKPFEMKGCSAIWSPVGTKLAEATINGEEIVYANINPQTFETQTKRLSERRPEQYKALGRHVAPWNLRATKKPRRIEAIAVQHRPSPGQALKNRKEIENLLAGRLCQKNASDQKIPCAPARLIVLPELSLIGQVPAQQIHHFAETLSGPTCDWAAKLAKQYKAFVVCGFAECAGKQFFNAALVVDPTGKRIGHARKIHLSEQDRGWATPGDQWTVVRSDALGRLGILIGNDSYVAESGTIMAIHRADIVAVPASWHGEVAGTGAIGISPQINPHAKKNAMVLWDEMAWGQQFYTVVANVAADDDQLGGKSGIYSTDPIYGIESPAFARSNGNEVIVGRFQTLNPDHWIDQQHYIGSRRPDAIYYPLLMPAKTPLPAKVPMPAITAP